MIVGKQYTGGHRSGARLRSSRAFRQSGGFLYSSEVNTPTIEEQFRGKFPGQLLMTLKPKSLHVRGGSKSTGPAPIRPFSGDAPED